MTWIKILWVAKKLNCTTVGKVCWKNVIDLIDNLVIKSHHTSLRRFNDIRYYLQWLFTKGIKKPLSKFIQHFYQDITKNKLTVTNKWNNPYLFYVCIIQFVPDSFERLIYTISELYICISGWMDSWVDG